MKYALLANCLLAGLFGDGNFVTRQGKVVSLKEIAWETLSLSIGEQK